MQKSQPLGADFQKERIDACRIAARTCQAGDHTEFDRVFADAKNDRDRRGRSFGRKRGEVPNGRNDNGYTTTDEIAHQCRQAIELALQPVVLHRHVLALDIADFAEAQAERGDMARNGRPAVDETDNRYRRLLRASGERPGDGRSADKRDELAPPHGLPLRSSPPYHTVACEMCYFASQQNEPRHFWNGSKPECYSGTVTFPPASCGHAVA